MDEPEPDSTGRPPTRRELRARLAAPASTATTDGAAAADRAPGEAGPAWHATGAQEIGERSAPVWRAPEGPAPVARPAGAAAGDAEVRWSLHHALPEAIAEETDEDDVQWVPPTELDEAEDGPGPTGGRVEEPALGTTALGQVEPSTGGVPRRRSVWQIDEAIPVPDGPSVEQDVEQDRPEPAAAPSGATALAAHPGLAGVAQVRARRAGGRAGPGDRAGADPSPAGRGAAGRGRRPRLRSRTSRPPPTTPPVRHPRLHRSTRSRCPRSTTCSRPGPSRRTARHSSAGRVRCAG